LRLPGLIFSHDIFYQKLLKTDDSFSYFQKEGCFVKTGYILVHSFSYHIKHCVCSHFLTLSCQIWHCNPSRGGEYFRDRPPQPSIESVQKRALRMTSHCNSLDVADIASLSTRRNELPRIFLFHTYYSIPPLSTPYSLPLEILIYLLVFEPPTNFPAYPHELKNISHSYHTPFPVIKILSSPLLPGYVHSILNRHALSFHLYMFC